MVGLWASALLLGPSGKYISISTRQGLILDRFIVSHDHLLMGFKHFGATDSNMTNSFLKNKQTKTFIFIYKYPFILGFFLNYKYTLKIILLDL